MEACSIHQHVRKGDVINHWNRVVTGPNRVRYTTPTGSRTVSNYKPKGMYLGLNDATSRPPLLLIKSLRRAPRLPSYHRYGFQSPPDIVPQRIPGFNFLND